MDIEARRLEALERYDLFGTQPDEEFDRFARLCASLFVAPICLVSLLGEHEQWFKAHHGVDLQYLARGLVLQEHRWAIGPFRGARRHPR